MSIRYKKLILSASIFNIIVGLFLLLSGISEFVGIINTQVHTVLETAGISLSYLIFINSMFILAAGVITVATHKKMQLMNLQMFLGIISLAWPLFLQISLFFTKLTINLRLVLSILTAMFYIISLFIVRISNNDILTKSYSINPSRMITQVGRRSSTTDISRIFKPAAPKLHKSNVVQSVGKLTAIVKPRKAVRIDSSRLLTGKRRKGGLLAKFIYTNTRRRSTDITKLFYLPSPKRKRRFK